MNKILFFIVIAITGMVVSCGSTQKQIEGTIVSISTDFGEIKVKLYDDTPLHKENFIKLANEGFYNGLLFHRVIKNFMIQGGDPDSKNAEKGARLGGGTPGYTIPAEIKRNHIHKRGALAAARLGGSQNPEKASSGSQFYIVQGEVYRPTELDSLAEMINSRRKETMLRDLVQQNNEKLMEFQNNDDRVGFNIFIAELREKVDSAFNAGNQFSLTDEEKQIYTTEGGYPSLDGEYTVFGEVIEGMEVVDKIAAATTDQNNRPEEDIRMKVEVLK